MLLWRGKSYAYEAEDKPNRSTPQKLCCFKKSRGKLKLSRGQISALRGQLSTFSWYLENGLKLTNFIRAVSAELVQIRHLVPAVFIFRLDDDFVDRRRLQSADIIRHHVSALRLDESRRMQYDVVPLTALYRMRIV